MPQRRQVTAPEPLNHHATGRAQSCMTCHDGKRAFGEVWVRNAFDTRYIPVAFPFDPRLAPSGFIGENGAPRTFGIRIGVMF